MSCTQAVLHSRCLALRLPCTQAVFTRRLSTVEEGEKLAASFALAQSAKLGFFECTVEKTIQDTRGIPERMARDGKVSLGRKQITMQLGQLFVDRASINLCAVGIARE